MKQHRKLDINGKIRSKLTTYSFHVIATHFLKPILNKTFSRKIPTLNMFLHIINITAPDKLLSDKTSQILVLWKET